MLRYVIATQWLISPLKRGINSFRIIICLKESEVTVERISVCIIIENLIEHGIHCLPCSYANDVIDVLSEHLWRHTDFRVMSSHCKKSVDFTLKYLGPVFQSIVSLTTSLKGQLVKYFTTL